MGLKPVNFPLNQSIDWWFLEIRRKVAVRNVRQAAMKKIKGLKSDLSEDVVGEPQGRIFLVVEGFLVDDFLSTNPSL